MYEDLNLDFFSEKNIIAKKDSHKLIDLQLANQLKFCNDLKNKYKDT